LRHAQAADFFVRSGFGCRHAEKAGDKLFCLWLSGLQKPGTGILFAVSSLKKPGTSRFIPGFGRQMRGQGRVPAPQIPFVMIA
jgi:hypothetical protein